VVFTIAPEDWADEAALGAALLAAAEPPPELAVELPHPAAIRAAAANPAVAHHLPRIAFSVSFVVPDTQIT
jgi:hypothetical protein